MVDQFVAKPWLNSTKTSLVNQIQQGILPHALLLNGSYGAGQDELSHWLAQSLLCQSTGQQADPCGECKTCQLFAAKSHPDLKLIDSGEGSIGVDLVRDAGAFLQKTSQLGAAKVVVIAASEQMTESAANALLKSLEEPTKNSYLLLICNDLALMLPTITSRCAKVNIQPPTGQGLTELENAATIAHQFSNISQFSELTDLDVQQQYQHFLQLQAQWLTDFGDNQELLQMLSKSIHGLRWFAQSLQLMVRIKLFNCQESMPKSLLELVDSYNEQQLWACLKIVETTSKRNKLLTQANKTFTIEAMLVDIEQTLVNN